MVNIATAKAGPILSISPHTSTLFPAIAIKPISVPSQPKYTAPFPRFFIQSFLLDFKKLYPVAPPKTNKILWILLKS